MGRQSVDILRTHAAALQGGGTHRATRSDHVIDNQHSLALKIPNDITGETRASFEPTLDYCVVKIPRWTFEKFPETEDFLTTAMKSVGETMAIGRTFKESLQKALRGLEIGRFGLDLDDSLIDPVKDLAAWKEKLTHPTPSRIFFLRQAMKAGVLIWLRPAGRSKSPAAVSVCSASSLHLVQPLP